MARETNNPGAFLLKLKFFNSIKTHFFSLTMIFLALFVLQTAVRIEVLNAQAGYCLPRKNRTEDGSFSDGKLRLSSFTENKTNRARNELREVLGTFGLLQYLLIPFLFIFAVLSFLLSKHFWIKIISSSSLIISLLALWSMLYREYIQSLGW